MNQVQKAWDYLLGQPFQWLWRYFFHIDQFVQETNMKDVKTRRKLLLRLMLPMFIVTYPLAFILGTIGGMFTFQRQIFYIPYIFYYELQPDLTVILLAIAVGTLSGIMVGIMWDSIANTPVGIVGGMWLGMWLGTWAGLNWLWWLSILLTTIGGLALGVGVVKGLGKTTIKNIDEHKEFRKRLDWRTKEVASMKDWISNAAEGMGMGVFYFTKGFIPGINQSTAKHLGMSIVKCILVSAIVLMINIVISSIGYDIQQWSVWWAITAGSLVGVVAGVARSSPITLGDILANRARNSSRTVRDLLASAPPSSSRSMLVDWGVGMSGGIIIGAMLGNIGDLTVLPPITEIIPAIIIAAAWSIGMYMGASSIGQTTRTNTWIFLAGIAVGILPGHVIAPGQIILIFLFCYFMSYTQIPLWLMSEVSIEQAAKATRENPEEVFTYLYGSALYWDEWEFLPSQSSSLTEMMNTAVEQDSNKALEIIAFIESERPLQVEIARQSVLDILTEEVSTQKTLRDIAETAERIAKLQSRTTSLGISSWVWLLPLLNDACLDATRYRNSLSWQARHDALQNMLKNLRNVNWPSVLEHWESVAQYELDKLQQESQRTNQINNPYVVGQALQPGTSLFVGRQDLVQQVEQGLGRGSHRPTFFLNGERRMGKSSTLRQLPYLLDTRHFLPIFFDLQAPEMTSSIAAFLGTIAEKIHETIVTAGIQIKVLDKKGQAAARPARFRRSIPIEMLDMEALDRKRLQEAQQVNEAQVYYVFNEWLKGVEQVLEKSRRIVLLSFDEFENLEMVGQTKYLDLHLLLNWFRSVIQNRPQLALLFSGGKSVSEMGMETGLNWSGYFVNVQTFRVSFLRSAEARQLITQPIPDYPIEQIFGDGVVDTIIEVTGCHPFLVQAVCSNLVNNLNAESRDRATIQDVEMAVTQVLEDWEDSYFQDLWIRTDQEQRACLIALDELGKGDLRHITQQVNGTKEITRAMLQTVRHTLQVLLKRDLVLLEDGEYRIATPIFRQWVQRSS